MGYKFRKPDELEFIDDNLLLQILNIIIGIPLGETIRFTKIKRKFWLEHASLPLFGKALQFDDQILERLSLHQKKSETARPLCANMSDTTLLTRLSFCRP